MSSCSQCWRNSIRVRSAISRAVTPCSLIKVHWRFGGKYCLHLQGRRASHARNEQSKVCFLTFVCLFVFCWRLCGLDSAIPLKIRNVCTNSIIATWSADASLLFRRSSVTGKLHAYFRRESASSVAIVYPPLLVCIHEVSGSSLGLDIGYAEWYLSQFTSVPPTNMPVKFLNFCSHHAHPCPLDLSKYPAIQRFYNLSHCQRPWTSHKENNSERVGSSAAKTSCGADAGQWHFRAHVNAHRNGACPNSVRMEMASSQELCCSSVFRLCFRCFIHLPFRLSLVSLPPSFSYISIFSSSLTCRYTSFIPSSPSNFPSSSYSSSLSSFYLKLRSAELGFQLTNALAFHGIWLCIFHYFVRC
jgi:hypothetical protein